MAKKKRETLMSFLRANGEWRKKNGEKKMRETLSFFKGVCRMAQKKQEIFCCLFLRANGEWRKKTRDILLSFLRANGEKKR